MRKIALVPVVVASVVAFAAPANAAASLPASYDLSQYAPVAGEQGSVVDSCSSWATGYTGFGLLMKEQGIAGGSMAPMYVYAQIVKGRNVNTSITTNLQIQKDQNRHSRRLPAGRLRLHDSADRRPTRERGALQNFVVRHRFPGRQPENNHRDSGFAWLCGRHRISGPAEFRLPEPGKRRVHAGGERHRPDRRRTFGRCRRVRQQRHQVRECLGRGLGRQRIRHRFMGFRHVQRHRLGARHAQTRDRLNSIFYQESSLRHPRLGSRRA